MGTTLTVTAGDGGTFAAYLAIPPGDMAEKEGAVPGLVLIQEIFGVNAHMRAVADRFAAAGFLAACPDLFWRLEPGVELGDQKQEDWDKAFDLYGRFDAEKGVEDLAAMLNALRHLDPCNGKVGAVGYCLGGKMAYLMAAHTNVDASVGYYGVGIEADLEDARNIVRPLMLHIAEEDQFVPQEAQQKIREGLGGHGQVILHSYPGADHAFAREGGAHYDADAAALADRRTLDFLKINLAR